MRTLVILLLASLFLWCCCGPKSYADTSIGKKKWKYFNKTQYGLHPKNGPNF